MRRGPLALAAVMTVALIAGFAAQQPGSDSPVPSVHNTGPRGLAVLAAWLGDATVVAHDAPMTELPKGVKTVVVAAPADGEFTEAEVAALRTFVETGGTFIYLASRTTPQPALNRWLELSPGPVAPLVNLDGLDDVGGSTVKVEFPAGLLRGAKTLRVSAQSTLWVGASDALPIASAQTLWWLRRGEGEIYLSAGADLAENARLELADNAVFWGHLADRGPVLFDEFHHHSAGRALPINLLVTAMQLVFLAALFLWARAPRLGPPRDPPPAVHRSSLDYVQALAALTQNAGVEAELSEALKTSFRRRLKDELALPVEWTWEAVDAELARRGDLTAGELVTASQLTAFVPLSVRLAELERKALG